MLTTIQLGMLQWPEIIAIIVVVLILFGARKLPDLWRGLGSGIDEFRKATRDVEEDLRKVVDDELMNQSKLPPRPSFSATLVLWIAQGFGIGRVPKGPGTFGSVLGLGWFALLLWIGGFQPLAAGLLLVLSLPAAVWTCDAAEKILGVEDPGSVVIDEIIAIPVCFLGWVFYLWLELGEMPSVDFFFGRSTWFLAFGVFLAFRFFDIVKPWPVRQSQAVPRGWGVVLDDLLAAVYVNLVVLIVHLTLRAING